MNHKKDRPPIYIDMVGGTLKTVTYTTETIQFIKIQCCLLCCGFLPLLSVIEILEKEERY